MRDGEMSPETLKIVSRELMPLEMYIQNMNEYCQQALKALEKNGSFARWLIMFLAPPVES